jgi:hypothetical protein
MNSSVWDFPASWDLGLMGFSCKRGILSWLILVMLTCNLQTPNSKLQTPYFLFCTLLYLYKISRLSTITPYTVGPPTLLCSLLVVPFLSKLLCYLHTILLLTSLPQSSLSCPVNSYTQSLINSFILSTLFQIWNTGTETRESAAPASQRLKHSSIRQLQQLQQGYLPWYTLNTI